MQIIFGIHAVEESLAARGRGFEYVAIAPGRGDVRIQKIAQLCRAAGIPVRAVPRDQLNGIEDPHNLGAIIRTAEGAGADGIVIPERRAVGVTPTVVKASAGASEYLPIARVTNIGRALEDLKSRNIWSVGLDERGSKAYDQLDYKMDCALVLGAEGHGLHEQVRKKCDFLVSIPMLGKVPSLNASVAAAIVMYELARQRRTKQS